jgi:hypothetical protein
MNGTQPRPFLRSGMLIRTRLLAFESSLRAHKRTSRLALKALAERSLLLSYYWLRHSDRSVITLAYKAIDFSRDVAFGPARPHLAPTASINRTASSVRSFRRTTRATQQRTSCQQLFSLDDKSCAGLDLPVLNFLAFTGNDREMWETDDQRFPGAGDDTSHC